MHANVQLQHTQLSMLMDAKLTAKLHLNENVAATLLGNRQNFLLCCNCSQSPFKSMLFLLILILFLSFTSNKSDCSLVANGISEGECCSFFSFYFNIFKEGGGHWNKWQLEIY